MIKKVFSIQYSVFKKLRTALVLRVQTAAYRLLSTNSRTKRGFTLLIAVLTASVLLAVGFAIYNIVSKELVFSSTGRESQFAFYAADSGIECALYWDKQGAFATSSSLTSLQCADRITQGTLERESLSSGGENYYQTTFLLWMEGVQSGSCAQVEVRKFASNRTEVRSFGYNTCVTSNPRRLERGIRAQY